MELSTPSRNFAMLRENILGLTSRMPLEQGATQWNLDRIIKTASWAETPEGQQRLFQFALINWLRSTQAGSLREDIAIQMNHVWDTLEPRCPRGPAGESRARPGWMHIWTEGLDMVRFPIDLVRKMAAVDRANGTLHDANGITAADLFRSKVNGSVYTSIMVQHIGAIRAVLENAVLQENIPSATGPNKVRL